MDPEGTTSSRSQSASSLLVLSMKTTSAQSIWQRSYTEPYGIYDLRPRKWAKGRTCVENIEVEVPFFGGCIDETLGAAPTPFI